MKQVTAQAESHFCFSILVPAILQRTFRFIRYLLFFPSNSRTGCLDTKRRTWDAGKSFFELHFCAGSHRLLSFITSKKSSPTRHCQQNDTQQGKPKPVCPVEKVNKNQVGKNSCYSLYWAIYIFRRSLKLMICETSKIASNFPATLKGIWELSDVSNKW